MAAQSFLSMPSPFALLSRYRSTVPSARISSNAALNRSMARTRPGPSRLLGARALRTASPIVSCEIWIPLGAGDAPSDGGGVARAAGAGDCRREEPVSRSKSDDVLSVPKIWLCEGGM